MSTHDLAPYATDPASSRGRMLEELDEFGRTPFQRDRDRIIHSAAFRRLKHKTQVFVYHEGDHYRTRLTHTLEVAQVARSIARALGLNEDLTEALSLAHDLGHPPFGHAGENELNICMARYGGFDHNAQALRIVTSLERRYAAFDGLNLTWETLEGLIKHNGPLLNGEGNPHENAPERELPWALTGFPGLGQVDLSTFATAEAQVAAISDDIAYNAHDIDDGLRAGLFDVIDLGDIPLAGQALAEVLTKWPDLDRSRIVHETVRRVISWMIRDVIENTRKRVARLGISSAADVHQLGEPLVALGDQMSENNRVLQRFLQRRMYHHERVMDIMGRARRVVRDLFATYMSDGSLMPVEWRSIAQNEEIEDLKARHICDFIAGMTDRYALEQHKRLFDLDPLFR